MTGDGMRERMEAAGVKKSIVFPLNDPNARDDYSGPNDVVWNAYEEYPSSLHTFLRLNPHLDYDGEFGRCVERGFMGLKLHPVSQKFELDDPRVVRLFGMAAAIDLPVLIHAGFAMQRIVEPLPPVEAHPGLRLILGHSAMVVLSAHHAFEGHQNAVRDLRCAGQRPVRALLLHDPSHRLRVGHTLWRLAIDAARHPRGGRGRWGA